MNAIPGDTGYIIIKKIIKRKELKSGKRNKLKQKEYMKRITKMYLCLLAFCITDNQCTNTKQYDCEVIPFKTIDGKLSWKPL